MSFLERKFNEASCIKLESCSATVLLLDGWAVVRRGVSGHTPERYGGALATEYYLDGHGGFGFGGWLRDDGCQQRESESETSSY